MDSQEVQALLEECLQAAAAAAAPPAAQLHDALKSRYCSCRDSLCAELASLLQEAEEMRWPFVPEKWQYKHSLSTGDKTNLSDLISKNLPQLLTLLKASVEAQEARPAQAVIFLVDRFLYWIDESSRLLKIARLLHERDHDAPIAPQLVIRQARVYFNSGNLQKAEYILSSLINNSGTTGCWKYQCESDRALVQAVCVQVRGMVLQKLGLWRGAAELIWASLVGYYALPQPDKKGIGTSLGLLANILVSMNDEDFHAFRTSPDIDFSLLGNSSSRLLSAAQAAKMAVVYSQYTSLYVLTNVVTQGTCLLSHSFSAECPAAQKQPFLLQAKEAFAIGLLTKAEGESVASKQELHTLIKAAYSLAVAQKWLGAPPAAVDQAAEACQTALEIFYNYCKAGAHEKDGLCGQIMHLVARVKSLLGVEPFPNSDKQSFIPDSYRGIEDISVNFTLDGFSEMMGRFQKYHASVCETTKKKCKASDDTSRAELCISAIGTTLSAPDTEAQIQDAGKQQQGGSAIGGSPLKPDMRSTAGSEDDLGSSWEKFDLSSSGSARSDSGVPGPGVNVVATKADGGGSFQDKERNPPSPDSGVASRAVPSPAGPTTSPPNASDAGFEVLQAGVETLCTDVDWRSGGTGIALSSTSLGSSFGSQSSWEKISADMNSPSPGKPRPGNLLKAGSGQRSKSQDSNESFFLCETLSTESSQSLLDDLRRDQTSAKLQPNVQTSVDSAPQAALEQNVATETSTDSSFEMLGQSHDDVTPPERMRPPQGRSPLCHSCLNQNSLADVSPERQFLLSPQDYRALLAGVCHQCVLDRFHSETATFKLGSETTASRALLLKFSKETGLWTAKETCVFIGSDIGQKGKQRKAIWVQFLHQEERLSSYVAKDYLDPTGIQFHLKDVERQMTAQYYVTEFNKSLYDRDVMAQIFFLPSEALLILDGDRIAGCVTVEPYMLGNFVKLTNNGRLAERQFSATAYGLAFGHFTYLFSGGQEVVVDLQGWVTANGKGLTYLTDPQIHSTMTHRGRSDFGKTGIRLFLKAQHGPECNEICRLLQLPPLSS